MPAWLLYWSPFIYHLLKDPSLLNRLFYFLPFLVIMLISPYGIRSMNRRMELEQSLMKQISILRNWSSARSVYELPAICTIHLAILFHCSH
ncbi:hypothetical protein PO124_02065 [Bacillus licheniformis]|nr:hypothetical protein [Bacillus licheniformis]